MRAELIATIIIMCFMVGIALIAIALHNQAALGFGNYLTYRTFESTVMLLSNAVLVALGITSIILGISLYKNRHKDW